MKRTIIALIIGLIITTALVVSGIDAWWFSHLNKTVVAKIFSLAGIVGFFMPVVLWVGLLIGGYVTRQTRIKTAAWVVAWAGFLGYMASILLKFFTGRVPPPHSLIQNVVEQSKLFQFGFYEGGIFWGWPSSHTATAFAMSVALAVFYKDKKWVGYIAIAYAAYIGLGASMSFHWLSDVVMGAIVGTVVGSAVGNRYLKKGSLMVR